MTVRNEARDTAVLRAAEAIQGPAYGKASLEKAARAVDALIAHGWGPRPTVTRDALVDHVARLEVPRVPVVAGVLNISAESMADALVPFLRECGIEVTDDRPE